ncbi:unnamed protein product [Effrenium voratum]|nr:unnamed protein product [Effrenium voratum]
METSLVQLIGQPKPPIPWPKHLLARAEARVMEPPLDPMMCQEQTAIARTFNDERFQEWEERRARKQVEEQKQLGLAVELAQASVFDQEAPLLLRLQKMLGRARSSSRSRSRGATSTSDGESEASGSGSSTSEECEDLEEEREAQQLSDALASCRANADGGPKATYQAGRVPVEVDFRQMRRVNLASRRGQPLRLVGAVGPLLPEKCEAEPQARHEAPSAASDYAKWDQLPCSDSDGDDSGALKLPWPTEVLSQGQSRVWLQQEEHRRRFLQRPHLAGRFKDLAEAKELQVSVDVFLEAAAEHLDAAANHADTGRSLFAEQSFEAAGRSFAHGIDELNKVQALQRLQVPKLKEEHRSLSCACLLNLAQCNLKVGNCEAALENCQEVLKLDETCAKAHFRRAKALEALGRDAAARAALRRAAQLAPRDPAVRAQLRASEAAMRERTAWAPRLAVWSGVERQAFRGLSGPPEQPFLRSILARACEYAGGHWKDRFRGSCGPEDVAAMEQLFAACVEAADRRQDFQLSESEVACVEAFGVRLPGTSGTDSPGDLDRQARAGLLLRRLQGGERLTPEEAEFLWMEQSKLEEALMRASPDDKLLATIQAVKMQLAPLRIDKT